tara:strand:- start:594 stop:761 length:168 start_codon:yes stop_codon:yes gene_type:complete
MALTKIEIQKLVEINLNEKEKQYYKKYLRYMVDNNFIEVGYFLRNKNIFFNNMPK